MKLDGTKTLADNPCVGKCSTHLGDETCRGCGRTFQEVNEWATYTRAHKMKINKRIIQDGNKKDI